MSEHEEENIQKEEAKQETKAENTENANDEAKTEKSETNEQENQENNENVENKEEKESDSGDENEEEEDADKEFVPKIPDLDETEPRNFDDDPSIMTLEKLPTWASEGLELVQNNPPKKFEAKYKADTEINEKISFWMRGNSAKLACDAVVNAANSYLAPGGGICGVLHGASGPEMAADCRKIGHTPTGKCAVTKGYKLPAKYCIHTVGPIGEQPEKLQQAYENTLACIDGEKIRSIGFCCISTGIYGYPIKPATRIALETVRKFLDVPENREKTDRIVFVVFERGDVAVYNQIRHEYFPLDIEYTFASESTTDQEDKEKDSKEKDKKEEDEKEKDVASNNKEEEEEEVNQVQKEEETGEKEEESKEKNDS